MDTDPDYYSQNYDEIARELAVNYFNVSLINGTENSFFRDANNQSSLEKVFPDYKVNLFRHAQFSRNILILGAGASELMLGDPAIDRIEETLGLDNLLNFTPPGSENKVFEKRYKVLASQYNKTVYESLEINDIKKQLLFEGRLSLLLNFYDKQDVLNEIKKILDIKFLPNRFYEIVAHLFKHRFIDIIINFNFDELLDNSIDDEIGPAYYHKIVHDSDCKPVSQLMEDFGLRTPIYIKPHGTISSKTSLLFTKEHYIDMSEDMKSLLHNIFMGKVGDSSQGSGIKNFNIFVAGFAMESIELDDLLFNQINRKAHKQEEEKLERIKYFIFSKDLDSSEEITDKFKTKLSLWKKRFKNKLNHPGPDDIAVFGCNEISLSDHFDNIYKNIYARFDKPFKPVELFLHDALTILFPQEKIKKIGKDFLDNDKDKYQKYLKSRFIFHSLYELVKWKGKLATDVIFYERPGKYYNEYLKTLEKSDRRKETDLISFIKDIKSLGPFRPYDKSDTIYELATFTDDLARAEDDIERKEIRDRFINTIAEEMIESCPIGENENNSIDEVNDKIAEEKEKLKTILNSIYDKVIYEISPYYNDVKHVRFRPIEREQIMPTGLTLTYKFFEYAVLRDIGKVENAWDELWFASDSGTPIFNLHGYCSPDRNPSYLEKFKTSNKSIQLIYSDNLKQVRVDSGNMRRVTHNGILVFVKEKIRELAGKFEPYYLKPQLNVHHMALFLKNGDPVFGFYFFKADASNRINPVYFEGDKNDNHMSNLQELKAIFEKQRGNAEKG